MSNRIILGSMAPSQKESRNINIIILGKLFKQTQQHTLISLIHTNLLGKLLMFTAWVLTSGSAKLKQKEMSWKHFIKSSTPRSVHIRPKEEAPHPCRKGVSATRAETRGSPRLCCFGAGEEQRGVHTVLSRG